MEAKTGAWKDGRWTDERVNRQIDRMINAVKKGHSEIE